MLTDGDSDSQLPAGHPQQLAHCSAGICDCTGPWLENQVVHFRMGAYAMAAGVELGDGP